MPIHDWSRVDAGLFHDFHQSWSVRLSAALNNGLLPKDYFALIEKRFKKTEGDVLALAMSDNAGWFDGSPEAGGVATVTREPAVRIVQSGESQRYGEKANVVRIHRKKLGNVVAVIEIVSPGNKKGQKSFNNFKNKSLQYLTRGIQLSIVDLFPPGKRDPQGIHGALWEELGDEPYSQPPDKPLTLVSYEVSEVRTAYVEPLAVGDCMIGMPIFLRPGLYVPMPLESTYMECWNAIPPVLKDIIEHPDQ